MRTEDNSNTQLQYKAFLKRLFKLDFFFFSKNFLPSLPLSFLV